MTTDPVPDLTIPLSTDDAQALGDDVGQLAMLLGTVIRGLAQLRADGTNTDDLATIITVLRGCSTGWRAPGTRPYASTPRRAARTARWRAPWASPGPPPSPAATPC